MKEGKNFRVESIRATVATLPSHKLFSFMEVAGTGRNGRFKSLPLGLINWENGVKSFDPFDLPYFMTDSLSRPRDTHTHPSCQQI